MTTEEFNDKWGEHLEPGHYGLAISDDKVIGYLDEEFEKLNKISPNFTYSQIKLKFGYSRVYMSNDNNMSHTYENEIDKLLKP